MYLETIKQETRLSLMFLDVKVLAERVQLHFWTLYLQFKNFKISSKKGRQRSES